MRRKAAVLIAGLTLLTLGLGSPARAQGYGGGSNGAFLSSTSLVVGGTVTISCATPPCADPGADARAGILSTLIVLGHMTADAAGGYSGTFRVPNVAAGPHTIVVDTTLNGQAVRYSTAVTVSRGGVGAASNGPGLPKTGQDIAVMAIIGLVLLGLGTAMVTSTRRVLRTRREARTAKTQEREPARV
jgi:LPXTG-motif cell wall-anchored protein